MSPTRPSTRHRASPPAGPSPSGMTLLEVLVSCGILVVGLASVAAILPAAGSRLGQAAVEDRAGTAAANAYAECVVRGLISADLFAVNTAACGFGRVLGSTGVVSVSPSLSAASSKLLDRIDGGRGFSLEDDLVFLPSAVGDTPINGFVQNGAEVSGHRLARDGVCWGGMLAPTSGTAAPGAEAILSIAVFRKFGEEPSLLELQQAGSGPLFVLASAMTDTGKSTDAPTLESVRKTAVPGCSYVLALPNAPGLMPAWIKVTSSWLEENPANPKDAMLTKSFVALDLDTLTNKAQYLNGSLLTVIGFPNLVRLDQYVVTLD